MIPATGDTLVLRPSRPSVVGAAPAGTDTHTPIVVIDIGTAKIGTFKIGEGTYDDFADPAVTDSL